MEIDTVVYGHVLDITLQMPDGCIHCSCTSPPYYGLRKYAGDQQCDWPEMEYSPMPGLPPITVEAMACALGHELTIEAYVGHLVAIYREVWRVLRDDGVAWIVMGDSYVGYKGSNYNKSHRRGTGEYSPVPSCHNQGTPHSGDLKAGDLMLVPHRLALALQAAGWTVRNDVVWAKKAPMPESVSGWRWERHRIKIKSQGKPVQSYGIGSGNIMASDHSSDIRNKPNPTVWENCPGCPKCEANGGYVLKRGSWRHTRAHEFVFMLTKRMGYWADQEAVREALAEASIERMNQPTFHEQSGGVKDYGSGSNRSARKALENLEQSRNGRNPRSVLSPSPEPFPGQHFAVYPTGLIESLIKATCPTRCCPECGQGWSPVVKQKHLKRDELPDGDPRHRPKQYSGAYANIGGRGKDGRQGDAGYLESNVLGYRPTCGCERDDYAPGIIFDPFMGAGTTAVIAVRLGLHFYGCDVSQKYIDIAMERVEEAQSEVAQMEMEL